MDNERAKEIATSPVMANVTYNGSRIYIENVEGYTATVHYLNAPEKRLKVNLSSLIEH